jgi:hypothetical protein
MYSVDENFSSFFFDALFVFSFFEDLLLWKTKFGSKIKNQERNERVG